jgi:acid phosphatase (class A)
VPSRFILILLFLATALGCPAQIAAPAAPPPAQARQFHYLSLTVAQELALIPPAPAPGSAVATQDMATILAVQAARTPEQSTVDRSYADLKTTLLTSVIGPAFTAANYTVTFAFLRLCTQDIFSVGDFLKNHYQRLRPYEVDPQQVKNLFPVPGFSYPSEHAEDSASLAGVLSLLFPGQSAALSARATAIAQSRVNAGVHFPSDIQQGAALGEKLVALFQANPSFQTALAAARAEIAAKPLPAVATSAATTSTH